MLDDSLNIVLSDFGLAIRMSDEEWNKVININLTAVFLICKYFYVYLFVCRSVFLIFFLVCDGIAVLK